MAAWDRARRTGEQNNGPHEASPIGAIHLLRAGGQTSATPPGRRATSRLEFQCLVSVCVCGTPTT